MQLSMQQQLELHELWTGINRARCDLVTAVDRLKEIEPAMLISISALNIAVRYVDGSLVDLNQKISNSTMCNMLESDTF